jgi:hypothetical protein
MSIQENSEENFIVQTQRSNLRIVRVGRRFLNTLPNKDNIAEQTAEMIDLDKRPPRSEESKANFL